MYEYSGDSQITKGSAMYMNSHRQQPNDNCSIAGLSRSWNHSVPLGYIDGANRYEYLSSQPIDRVDPSGLFSSLLVALLAGQRIRGTNEEQPGAEQSSDFTPSRLNPPTTQPATLPATTQSTTKPIDPKRGATTQPTKQPQRSEPTQQPPLLVPDGSIAPSGPA